MSLKPTSLVGFFWSGAMSILYKLEGKIIMENYNMTKPTETNPKFKTNSFLLACILMYFNFPIEVLDRSNARKIVFIFSRTNKLDETVEAFWRDNLLQVNPKAFFHIQKELKERIYSGE